MPNLTRRFLLSSATVFLAGPCVVSRSASQPAWPSGPVKIIVPYAAGGQTDSIARIFGDFLSRHLGARVVVENKGGGSGVIGVSEVVRAPADGHTILCSLSPPLVQNRVLVRNLPYDPEKDLVYLTTINTVGVPVVVSESTGVRNLVELVDYARSTKRVNFGAYGLGTIPHVLARLLSRQYDVPIETVQYRGEAPMWSDLMNQTLEVAAGSYAGALPVIQSGRGKLIAVLGERLPTFPDVPTLIEQGARGEAFGATAFTTFAVRAGTPQEVTQKLAEALVLAATDPKVKEVLAALLAKPPTSLEAAKSRFMEETRIVLSVLEDLKIKAD